MKRRTFLSTGAAVGAAALWPAWIARAFDPQACGGDRAVELFDAYRAARRMKKPLLVFVIPARDEDKWLRGTLLGQALNHGDDETLASLSLVALACATLDELSRLITLPVSESEPWVVRVDTLKRPNSAQGYAIRLPARPEESETKDGWDALRAREDTIVDREIREVSQLFRRAIQPVQPQSGERAAKLDFAVTALAQRIAQDELPDAAEVEPHARELWAPLSLEHAGRERMLHALAETVRTLLKQPIRGSRWASSFGCATTIENDDDDRMVMCGMGHVPAKSTRFLYFFTKRPYE